MKLPKISLEISAKMKKMLGLGCLLLELQTNVQKVRSKVAKIFFAM